MEQIFHSAGTQLNHFFNMNRDWRMIIAVVLILCGLAVMEMLIRYIRKSYEPSGKKRGLDITIFFAPIRLATFGILLRVAESPLQVPEELARLFHAVEGLFIALAALLFLLQLIALADRVEQQMPDSVQDALPNRIYGTLKNLLRLAAVIGVTMAYIYAQKEFMPEWLTRYEWWRYALISGVIIIIYLFNRLIAVFLGRLTEQMGDSRENMRLRLVLRSALWPVRLLLLTIVLYAAREILQVPAATIRFADIIISAIGTVAVILFVYRLIDVMEFELARIVEKDTNLLDQNFVHVMRLIARFVVIIVGAIYLVRAISGKPLSALLAGLGIGGIAVALAAQDTLKNLLGSIMIMIDKPFKVGQRVVVESTDGVVEEIGFRSTRVRTLTGHLVTVPNEKMAGNRIENIGLRPHIRRLANITITYDTPVEKVKRGVEIIRQILENHEGMHPDFPPRVFFNEFNDASLNILMLYWYHPNDYWAYCAFTEKVNIRIMEAFEAEGIEFAFPTTTTYLAQDDRRPLHVRFSEMADSGHSEYGGPAT